MKDKLYIFWTFIKSHKWIVSFSFILIFANIVITNNIIDSDVESSRESLESQMRDINIAVYQDNDIIVTYREEKKPSVLNYIKQCAYKRRPLINYKGEDYIDWDDTLSYNQIYSQIEHYYVAKSGWEVKTYAFQQNQIVETVIRPSSFGSYPNCTTSPTDAFKYLYEFIKRENSSHDIIKESTWDDIDIESDYHYLDKHEFQLPPQFQTNINAILYGLICPMEKFLWKKKKLIATQYLQMYTKYRKQKDCMLR